MSYTEEREREREREEDKGLGVITKGAIVTGATATGTAAAVGATYGLAHLSQTDGAIEGLRKTMGNAIRTAKTGENALEGIGKQLVDEWRRDRSSYTQISDGLENALQDTRLTDATKQNITNAREAIQPIVHAEEQLGRATRFQSRWRDEATTFAQRVKMAVTQRPVASLAIAAGAATLVTAGALWAAGAFDRKHGTELSEGQKRG